VKCFLVSDIYDLVCLIIVHIRASALALRGLHTNATHVGNLLYENCY